MTFGFLITWLSGTHTTNVAAANRYAVVLQLYISINMVTNGKSKAAPAGTPAIAIPSPVLRCFLNHQFTDVVTGIKLPRPTPAVITSKEI